MKNNSNKNTIVHSFTVTGKFQPSKSLSDLSEKQLQSLLRELGRRDLAPAAYTVTMAEELFAADRIYIDPYLQYLTIDHDEYRWNGRYWNCLGGSWRGEQFLKP